MQSNEKEISFVLTTSMLFKVAAVGLLCWFIFLLRDLVLILLASIVIASAVEPAVKLFGRLKIPRVFGVLLVFVISAAFLSLVVLAFVPKLIEETSALIAKLPALISSANALLGARVANIPDNHFFDLANSLSVESFLVGFKNTFLGASGAILGTAGAFLSAVGTLFLTLVLSFYFAVQERGVENFLRVITPLTHEQYALDLWRRSREKIGLWMQGQVILGILIGILVFLGLLLFGVEYALLLAILAALCELIPLFGPIIAMIPAVAIGFVDGGFTLGVGILLFYIIIQLFENHLLYPLVVKKVVGVSPLLVILALIIGGKLAGFIGVLISVPVAAALVEFTNDILKQKDRRLVGGQK